MVRPPNASCAKLRPNSAQDRGYVTNRVTISVLFVFAVRDAAQDPPRRAFEARCENVFLRVT